MHVRARSFQWRLEARKGDTSPLTKGTSHEYNSDLCTCCRQKKAALEGRRDAKLQNVVISERYDKKAAKFNVASLPFPYTSKAAFEGNMRQPLGAEFNTQTSFRYAVPFLVLSKWQEQHSSCPSANPAAQSSSLKQSLFY